MENLEIIKLKEQIRKITDTANYNYEAFLRVAEIKSEQKAENKREVEKLKEQINELEHRIENQASSIKKLRKEKGLLKAENEEFKHEHLKWMLGFNKSEEFKKGYEQARYDLNYFSNINKHKWWRIWK